MKAWKLKAERVNGRYLYGATLDCQWCAYPMDVGDTCVAANDWDSGVFCSHTCARKAEQRERAAEAEAEKMNRNDAQGGATK